MAYNRPFVNVRTILTGLGISVFVVLLAGGITAYKWTYQCEVKKVSPDGRFALETCPLGYLRLRTSQGMYLNKVRTNSLLDAFDNLEWKSNSVYFTYYSGGIAIAEWPLINDSPIAAEYAQRDLQYRLAHTYNIREMENLIAKGANPNVSDINGRNKLFETVSFRNTDIIRFLLEHGADVHLRDTEGKTVLHVEVDYAIHNTDTLPAIQYLVEQGADVNAVDTNGQTPLHILDKIEEIKFLVEHGANINTKDHRGNTPLDSITLRKKELRKRISGDVNSAEYDEPLNKIAAYLKTKGAITNTTK